VFYLLELPTIEKSLNNMNCSTPLDQQNDIIHPRLLFSDIPICDWGDGPESMENKIYCCRDVSILISQVIVSPLPYASFDVEKAIIIMLRRYIWILRRWCMWGDVGAGSSFRLRRGAKSDPGLTDSILILDSFTRLNLDPSPLGDGGKSFR
jgi:hypothetical protein